jgi:hypothetical protein
MHTYLGPLGGMVALKCPSGLRPSSSRPMSTSVTLGGVSKAQMGPRTARTWDVSLDAVTPAELAGLAALVEGELGVGPFAFVDPWARVTNLMPPSATIFPEGGPKTWGGPAVPGGPVDLADGGRAPSSLLSADGAAGILPYRRGLADGVPVVPGQVVTGSMYVSGPGTLDVRLQFSTSVGGTFTTAAVKTVTNTGPELVRVDVTATAPDGAVAAVVRHAGATRIARPAITWTPTVLDWMPGQGAPRVVVPDLAHAVILAMGHSTGGRYTAASFTVREVG